MKSLSLLFLVLTVTPLFSADPTRVAAGSGATAPAAARSSSVQPSRTSSPEKATTIRQQPTAPVTMPPKPAGCNPAAVTFVPEEQSVAKKHMYDRHGNRITNTKVDAYEKEQNKRQQKKQTVFYQSNEALSLFQGTNKTQEVGEKMLPTTPENLRRDVSQALLLQFENKDLMSKQEIEDFVHTKQLQKNNVASSYEGHTDFINIRFDGTEILPQKAADIVAHKEKFTTTLAKLKIEQPKETTKLYDHGAAFYKDAKTGHSIELNQTYGPDDFEKKEQALAALTAVRGKEGSTLWKLSDIKNDLRDHQLPALQKTVEETVKTLSELKKDRYKNAATISKKEAELAEQKTEIARLTALVKGAALARDIQEQSSQEINANAGYPVKALPKARWGAGILNMFAAAKSPHEVWIDTTERVVKAKYEDKLTRHIQARKTVEAAEAERQKTAQYTELTKTTRLGYPQFKRETLKTWFKKTIFLEENELVELSHTHYADALEAMDLQKPNFEKMMQQNLSPRDFALWKGRQTPQATVAEAKKQPAPTQPVTAPAPEASAVPTTSQLDDLAASVQEISDSEEA